jgi:hypothetical protein
MEKAITVDVCSENFKRTSKELRDLLSEGWEISKMQYDTEVNKCTIYYIITLSRSWE